MNRKQLAGIFTIVAAIVALGSVLAYRVASRHDRAPSMVRNGEAPANPAPTLARSHAFGRFGKIRTPAAEDDVRSFREKYGNDLNLEFHDDGRLSAIRGAPGAGTPAGGDYRSDDPQKAIVRAREIIDAARDLIGLQNSLPLENPVANATGASAQVRFQETLGGVPLAPIGDVSVDLGPQGEILGLDSSYLPDVIPENDSRVGPDQARQSAVSSLPENEQANARADGGAKVIWVLSPRGDSGRPSSRYAYQYSVDGRQVVVDAGNGSVILRRDRRNF